MINWNTSKADSGIVSKIIDRYIASSIELGIPKLYQRSRLDLTMDIEACHNNGNPLKLQELLGADDFNFIHDVIGIQQHINRETGELMDCFLPRYSV